MNATDTATPLPWLLRGARHVSSPCIIRDEAVVRFGELAHVEPDQLFALLHAARTYAPHGNKEASAEWRRAVAEELLLVSALGHKMPPALLQRWGKERPLDTCVLPLERLAGRRAAVAVIPLATSASTPACAHLWLIHESETVMSGATTWRSLPRSIAISGDSYAVHTVISQHKVTLVDGTSYALALALMKRALAHDDQRAVKALALDWIVSGVLRNEQVIKIELGNKLRLSVPRRWLLPAANECELTHHAPSVGALDHTCVRTVDDAYNVITDAGPIKVGRIDWPRKVHVLHSFISGAYPPVIACALLSAPSHIVLWHSGPRWLPHAESVRDVLRHFLPVTEITLRQISSSDLCAAERTLRDAVADDLREDFVTLFNITQGNRLMSFAALEVAKRYHSVWLVYRDVDARPFEFTMIRYERSNLPHTYTLVGSPSDGLRVRWDVLFCSTEKIQMPESPAARACAIIKELSEPSPEVCTSSV